MVRSAAITIALYTLVVAVLPVPLLILFLGDSVLWRQLLPLFKTNFYWGVVGTLAFAQGLLLVVPGKVAEGAEVKPGHIVLHSAVAGLLMGVLAVWLALCALVSVLGDYLLDEERWVQAVLVVGPLFFGALWAARFWSLFYKTGEPRRWMLIVRRKILTAAAIELAIVAAARISTFRFWGAEHRFEYEVASNMAFSGIFFGLTAVLMAWGPDLFFLLAERRRRRLARRAEETETGRPPRVTRWAVITIGLYLLLLVLLTTPAAKAAFWHDANWPEILGLYVFPLYWTIIAVFVLAQALLLLVPVRAAKGLEIRERHILVPSLAAGLMMGILVVSGLLCLLAAVFAEGMFEDEWQGLTAIVAGLLFFWGLWAALFRSFSYTTPEPHQWMRRIVRWLFIGSIVELLVAVGSHIVVRRRGDCSAPVATFWGIAAGTAVMFMAFGPGVFFLFAERKRRITPRLDAEAPESTE